MEIPNIPTTTFINETAGKKPKKGKLIILVLITLVLLAAGGLIYFLANNKQTATPLANLVPFKKDCDASQNSSNYQKGTSKYPKLDFANNKIGVYSYADTDSLEAAGPMVNSNGGDWGWVLIPFNIKQTSVPYWNSVMETVCKQHLIPILQLFNDGKPPTDSETKTMAEFLSGLKWPTKLKFITAYNEVNASEYWGGKIDPEGYAKVLNLTIDELKKRDKNFFVMNGAFNSSARSNPGFKTDLGVFTAYLDLPEYLDRMEKAAPGIFKKLDGWAAHTYPHPAYKGKPTDLRVPGESDYEAGRNTIRSYQYDLKLLKDKFAVDLPVFITETGWPHLEGTTTHNEWLPAKTVAQYYLAAFNDIFLPDQRVIAVTPFIMKLKGIDNFAFIDGKDNPYPQYEVIKAISKTSGHPELQ